MSAEMKLNFEVSWSAEDQEWVATCREFPSLSWLDEEAPAALQGLINVVHEVLVDMVNEGEQMPVEVKRLAAC